MTRPIDVCCPVPECGVLAGRYCANLAGVHFHTERVLASAEATLKNSLAEHMALIRQVIEDGAASAIARWLEANENHFSNEYTDTIRRGLAIRIARGDWRQ